MASSITLYDDAGTPVVVDGEAMKYVSIDPDGVALTGQDLTDVGIIGSNPQAKLYPDGSIVGSSDNGTFSRYPNGDLTCTGFTSVSGSDGLSYGYFALEFTPSPSTSGALVGGSHSAYPIFYMGGTDTLIVSVVMRLATTGATIASRYAKYIAIGRWK